MGESAHHRERESLNCVKTICKQGSVELAEVEGTSCWEGEGGNGHGFEEGAEDRRKEESHRSKGTKIRRQAEQAPCLSSRPSV